MVPCLVASRPEGQLAFCFGGLGEGLVFRALWAHWTWPFPAILSPYETSWASGSAGATPAAAQGLISPRSLADPQVCSPRFSGERHPSLPRTQPAPPRAWGRSFEAAPPLRARAEYPEPDGPAVADLIGRQWRCPGPGFPGFGVTFGELSYGHL